MADSRSNQAINLLAALIRCPSVTPKTAGALDVLEDFLTPLGFACTRLTFEGDGSYPVENLFATRGMAGRHLLFAGHTDVVPPGDTGTWTHDPFGADVAAGRLWGRGAVDMKSGIAAFCGAVAELVASGQADLGRISLAITNDEEADAVNGTDKLMAWTQDQGHTFDFAVVGEPSSQSAVGDSIKIGRRGSLNGRITVTGVQGHAAYPEKARNPLPVLARVATALIGEALDGGTDHFQPSNLELTAIDTGNPASNVIPASAVLRFNIRFNDLWDEDKLTAWINERIVALDAAGCTIAVEVVGRVSRCFLSPRGADIAHMEAAIREVTGRAPELSTGGGTSDARYIARYCPVIECGLVGATMHQVDEHVPVADFERLTRIYRAFITRFFGAA